MKYQIIAQAQENGEDFLRIDASKLTSDGLFELLNSLAGYTGHKELCFIYSSNSGKRSTTDKFKALDKDKFAKLITGLKGTSFSDISFDFYPMDTASCEIFYDGLLKLTNMETLNFYTIEENDYYHAALLNFIEKTDTLKVLNIGIRPSDVLMLKMIKAVAKNPKPPQINVDGLSPEMKTKLEAAINKSEPTAESTNDPKQEVKDLIAVVNQLKEEAQGKTSIMIDTSNLTSEDLLVVLKSLSVQKEHKGLYFLHEEFATFTTDKIKVLDEDKLTKLMIGLNEPSFTSIGFNMNFYLLNAERCKIFYDGLLKLTHMETLSLEHISKNDHAALLNFVQNTETLKVLNIRTRSLPDDLILKLIEATEKNLNAPQIKINGLSKELQDRFDAAAKKSKPAAENANNPKTIDMSKHDSASLLNHVNTPNPITENIPSTPQSNDVNLHNFLNNLFNPQQTEHGKFTHRVSIKENAWKKEIADNLYTKLSGNKELIDILKDPAKAEQMISSFLNALSHVKVNDNRTVYNVGLWNGATFVEAMASFFHAIIEQWNGKKDAMSDWWSNKKILVIDNKDKFLQALEDKSPKKEQTSRVLDALIESAASQLTGARNSRT